MHESCIVNKSKALSLWNLHWSNLKPYMTLPPYRSTFTFRLNDSQHLFQRSYYKCSSLRLFEIHIDYKTCHEGAWPARISDVFKKDPFFAEAEKWAGFDRSLRGKSPTPVKPRISQPRETEVAFDADGKGNRPLNILNLRHDPWILSTIVRLAMCSMSNVFPTNVIWVLIVVEQPNLDVFNVFLKWIKSEDNFIHGYPPCFHPTTMMITCKTQLRTYFTCVLIIILICMKGCEIT